MIPQDAVQAEIDRRNIAAAQLRLDAEAGADLIRAMDARHFEQGYLAAQMRLSADHPGLYSKAHRAGYAAGMAGERITFTDAAAPALLRI